MRGIIIGLVDLLRASSPAFAPSLPVSRPPAAPERAIELAATHSHTWKYTGPRSPYRYGPFAYYYDGWWYPRPWWYGPGLAFKRGMCGSCGSYEGTWHDYDWGEGGYTEGTDPHVEWCIEHYRSYDNGSDTYLGSDGGGAAAPAPATPP